MLDFKTHRRLSENTPPVGTNPAVAAAIPSTPDISGEIDKAIDLWTSELISTLMGTAGGATGGDGSGAGTGSGLKPRGLWDRFKNTVSNFWHGGRDSATNPYRWVNKFGDDLGRPMESFSIELLSLDDYRLLKETCMDLEQQLNEAVPGVENLRLVKLIKAASEKLKGNLKRILKTSIVSSPAVNPANKNDPAKAADPIADPAKAADPTPTPVDPIADPAKAAEPKRAADFPPEEYKDTGHKEFEDKPSTNPAKTNDPMDVTTKGGTAKATDFPPEEYKDTGHKEFEDKPSTNPPTAGDKFTTPPSTGKSWADLTGGEIDKWNQYGGGVHPRRIRGDCFKYTKGAPIDYIPWILRTGDPRIDVLKSQSKDTIPGESFADKYLDKDKVASSGITNPRFCKKRHAAAYNWLMSQGRIETSLKPIQSKEDLMDRIEIIKSQPQREMPTMAEPTPEPEPDSAVNDASPEISSGSPMPDNSPRNTGDDAAVEPSSPATLPKAPGRRRSTVRRGDLPPTPPVDATAAVPPTGGSHPTDTTSLSRPYGDDGGEAPRMNRREKREFDNEKEALEARISDDNFPPEFLVDYTELLQKAKSLDDLKKIKSKIDELAGGGEFDIDDWNLSDYVTMYKNKLRQPVTESVAQLDKKVLKSLPIGKKVQYLKECLVAVPSLNKANRAAG